MRLLRPAANWTVKMLDAIPEDGNRYELIDGELLVNGGPGTLHRSAFLKLLLILDAYARRHALATASISLLSLDLSGPRIERPDAIVSRPVEGQSPDDWSEVDLLLALDSLDPRYGHSDDDLCGRYAPLVRVPEYWVLDVDRGAVWVSKPGDKGWPKEIDGRLEWQPDPAIPPLIIDLPEFFEGA
jgi:Uma2 family endonuclease